MRDDLVGHIFKTKKHGDCVILKYTKHNNVTVRFIDTNYVTTTSLTHIKNGFVKDKYAPSVHGVGVVGDFNRGDNIAKQREYILWCNMLARCYLKTYHERNPSYVNCSASDNFKFYPFFKEWCNRQVGFSNEDWVLDKDILFKSNKIYSEDTCVFVPHTVNQTFVHKGSTNEGLPIGVSYDKRYSKYVSYLRRENKQKFLGYYNAPEEAFFAYKQAKEDYIKEIANKWKDQIDPRIHEALMNWTVEITD